MPSDNVDIHSWRSKSQSLVKSGDEWKVWHCWSFPLPLKRLCKLSTADPPSPSHSPMYSAFLAQVCSCDSGHGGVYVGGDACSVCCAQQVCYSTRLSVQGEILDLSKLVISSRDFFFSSLQYIITQSNPVGHRVALYFSVYLSPFGNVFLWRGCLPLHGLVNLI